MAGDRYGWVPLLYSIEEKEFDTLLELIPKDEQTKLVEWYKLDLNQIPASYILKERIGKYEAYEEWEEVETSLRAILQKAVHSSDINEEEKNKYFQSATESEVIEGILPYFKKTKHQENLEDDTDHIFGFFRDIDKSTQIEDKFITDDYDKAQKFKDQVGEILFDKNKLKVNTTQRSKDKLDENYLDIFGENILSFLKKQLDEQKSFEDNNNATELEIEQEEQNLFLVRKLHSFVETEKLKETLQSIKSYILDNNKSSALVIFGSSGRGKSSLMAKAISDANTFSKRKIAFRFVGATPYSSTSKDILTSIFQEFGISIDAQEKSFEQFSELINKKIMKLDKEVIVFIDAVDQLEHDDNFLWLPEIMPANVKIIISTLNDEHYKKDTKYFNTLQNKTDQIIEIPVFDEPLKLIKNLLQLEHRTLQTKQEEYFLQQFETANSPLYVTVAAQELKHWKSSNLLDDDSNGNKKVQALKATNRGIIEEFLDNLVLLFHHNEEFVYKVLGYLYASRDGLSESELLQLLSSNREFVERMSPETFYKNITKELPLVYWSRLYSQLRFFLSQKTQDNEELKYFFHREFEDVIKALPMQKQEHEDIIGSSQRLIEQYQNENFTHNRFGKLYSILITQYDLRYKDKKRKKDYAQFISFLSNETWIDVYLDHLTNTGETEYLHNRMFKAIASQESYLETIKILNDNKPIKYLEKYNKGLKDLATTYKYQNRQDEALKLEEVSIEISKQQYEQEPLKYALSYCETLLNLARSHYNQNRLEKAVKLEEIALNVCKKNYEEIDPDKWAYTYTRALLNLARTFYNFNRLKEGIPLLEDALVVRKKYFEKDPSSWVGFYTIALNDLAFSYKDQSKQIDAIPLEEEALKIRRELYKKTPSRWPKDYTRSLNNLSATYKYQRLYDKAIELEEESHSIMKGLYEENPQRWGKDYTITLDNLGTSYRDKNRLDESIELLTESLDISSRLLNEDFYRWVEYYTRALTSLALSFKLKNQTEEALSMEIEAYEVTQKLFNENPDRWQRDYARTLNNLALTYKKIDKLDNALNLEEVSLDMSRSYFEDDPNRWVDIYTNALEGLADSLFRKNEFTKASELQKELVTITKSKFKNNPAHWEIIYNKAVEIYQKNLKQ
ncbi:protein containing tetratricopeptide repeat [Sulfurimonas gotlandica GD1]|uniref:Protein containing tetratricopeptide repeat n=2 Tax=Sulfurimonas TaxID=202746 RepID=B6BL06_SULGG|nr:tetratricopeptide repeat domain protein [Sulfurimonas gotlandica GD1]EHP28738.1 protein containing tetratricopeptide repeat [Sulfurimonas gotlandica GD1]